MRSLLLFLALAVSFAAKAESTPAVQLSSLITEQQLQALTGEERAELQKNLAEFNKSPYVLYADSSNSNNMISIKAFCLGGKVALGLFGIQGLRCVTTNKKIVTIFMSGDRSPVTGFVAKGYVGMNVGLSGLAGMAIISCPVGSCSDFNLRGYYSSNSVIDGGTINGAYGWVGALVGYYSRGESTLQLYAYQAGLAAEVAASQVQLYMEDER